MATVLPMTVPSYLQKDLPRLLGGLGYPGFAYLANAADVANPAAAVLTALRDADVPARVAEGLPWVLATFPELNWNWLLNQAKLTNVQNRLGFLVTLAKAVAEARGDTALSTRFREVLSELEDARLMKEDTLGRSLTEVERRHLRSHRSPDAAHWNLLTSLRAEDLRY